MRRKLTFLMFDLENNVLPTYVLNYIYICLSNFYGRNLQKLNYSQNNYNQNISNSIKNANNILHNVIVIPFSKIIIHYIRKLTSDIHVAFIPLKLNF